MERPGIERALQEADAYIVLLTPESTLRPWVNFGRQGSSTCKSSFSFFGFKRLQLETFHCQFRQGRSTRSMTLSSLGQCSMRCASRTTYAT